MLRQASRFIFFSWQSLFCALSNWVFILQEKASEILSVICEGFKAEKAERSDKLEPTHSGTPSPPESAANKGFKSDHIVSRMKLFFQGKDTQNPQRSQSPQPQRRWEKRRRAQAETFFFSIWHRHKRIQLAKFCINISSVPAHNFFTTQLFIKFFNGNLNFSNGFHIMQESKR